jgi:hypothetical protein
VDESTKRAEKLNKKKVVPGNTEEIMKIIQGSSIE